MVKRLIERDIAEDSPRGRDAARDEQPLSDPGETLNPPAVCGGRFEKLV